MSLEQTFQNYQSINVEQYHNLKLKYIAPYWMDYKNPLAIQFVEKFKKSFGTEPSSFGAQGFDAAFYFLNAFKFPAPALELSNGKMKVHGLYF